MRFKVKFDPKQSRLAMSAPATGRDLRDGSVYVCDRPTVLAIQVAIATGRPLLLGGRPGSGKSSLAAFVARDLGWNYFEATLTSRSQARDLQYTVDEIRRLRDAQIGKHLHEDIRAYMEPGVLWWTFSPRSALLRGFDGKLPDGIFPANPPGELRDEKAPCVLLFDEIDKADPDVPDDILVALGSHQFQLERTNKRIESDIGGRPPLIIITTNRVRSLSTAFIRRCVVFELKDPGVDRLVEIAEAHFPSRANKQALFRWLAEKVVSEQQRDHEIAPSTAEYLDAIQACLELKLDPSKEDSLWDFVEDCVLNKRRFQE